MDDNSEIVSLTAAHGVAPAREDQLEYLGKRSRDK